MEPRELWERNTVLAEAFCASDERVRSIQAELDDAQVCRTRRLAAFAVIVGNDGSAADVMGLSEREVRVARRTVGKEDARSLAAELLRQSAEPPVPAPEPEQPPAGLPEGVTMPGQRSESPLQEAPAQPSAQAPVPGACATGAATMGVTAGPVASPAPSTAPGASTAATDSGDRVAASETAFPHVSVREEPAVWSPAMDSVLLWSWQSGIDLQAVAAELDMDVRALLQRVQALAAEGLLVWKPSPADSGQAGRHRRHEDFFVSAPDSPEELYTHAGYLPQQY